MSDASVQRQKTAIRRVRCSRPVAIALAEGIITAKTSVLDYGCGHGADIRYLKSRGVDAVGWDPHFAPNADRRPSAVVNLGYVLNVIEKPEERRDTLLASLRLATSALVVSVRVDRALDEATTQSCGDGVLTDRGTFQKLYTQDEFRLFVESTTGKQMHTAALGIGYVFTADEAEQRFLAGKAFTRRLEYRTDLIAEFGKDRTARELVRLATRLGRVPLPEEFPNYEQLLETFGSSQRVERLLLAQVDREAYEGSRAESRNDMLVYLAMLRLQGIAPPPFRSLPAPVQGDVKAIWGSYERAVRDGSEFLFALGRPEAVKLACNAAAVGKLLPGDLYVHRSAEDELPALLRVILFAAKRVVGELEYDLAKVATDGRAVAFLSYDGFDEIAHPALTRSVRVYLPKASYEVRDYRSQANRPVLHRKDALVTPDYPRYQDFRSLTEQEEKLGLLSSHDIGFQTGWEALLASRGLVVEGHHVRPLK